MTVKQNPRDFPVFNSKTKVSDKNGNLSKEFINYLSSLHSKLTNTLTEEGLNLPSINNNISSQIISNKNKTIPKIVYNSEEEKYQILVKNGENFEFKNIAVE